MRGAATSEAIFDTCFLCNASSAHALQLRRNRHFQRQFLAFTVQTFASLANSSHYGHRYGNAQTQMRKLFLCRRRDQILCKCMPSTASEALEPSRQHQRDLMQLVFLQLTKVLDLNGLSAPKPMPDVRFGIDMGEDDLHPLKRFNRGKV